MERNRYINCTWWLPTAYGSTPLPPQWGSSFTETPQMLLMLWRVMACVHLHRTVALASGGLGSAEAWFIDNPGVSAATLTIQSQTNGQVDDDGRLVKEQHAGKFLVVAFKRDVLSQSISWSIYTHPRLTSNQVLMEWLANHSVCQVSTEKRGIKLEKHLTWFQLSHTSSLLFGCAVWVGDI